jgi:hypothetical protein
MYYRAIQKSVFIWLFVLSVFSHALTYASNGVIYDGWGGGAVFYTSPGSSPYDGLITNDPVAPPLTPKSLQFNVNPLYWYVQNAFDDGGHEKPVDFKPSFICVPVGLGFAFNEYYMGDVTLQLLAPAGTYTDPVTKEEYNYSATGCLGDLWVKGRRLWDVLDNFRIGPRIGLKIPVGKSDYGDDEIELGDDQVDIDVAVVAGRYSEINRFAGSAQIGMRYRTKKTLPYYYWDPVRAEMRKYEYYVTPGILAYFDVEPGINIGADRSWGAFFPLGYTISFKDQFLYPSGWPGNVPQAEGVSHWSLHAGLHPKYYLGERATVGFKVAYNLIGRNAPHAMYFGVTFTATNIDIGEIKF